MPSSLWPSAHRPRCHVDASHGLILSLALCLLLTSSARAAPSATAEVYVLSAARLYKELDYEGALNQIRLGREETRSQEQELTLLLYEGIILAALNRWPESTTSFRAALTLNVDATLPVRVSPKVEAHFESVRAQVKGTTAAEALTPEPPSAEGKTAPQSPRRYAPIVAGAGGGLVVTGGISWALSRIELHRLRTASPGLASREAVQRSVSRGQTWQTLGLSLMGAGTAGLLTAAGMYVFSAPSKPVALGVGTNGQSAFVYGTWP